MRSTNMAYQTWEVEQGSLQDLESIDLVDIYPDDVVSSYQKALEMYNVGNIVRNVYSRATKNCPWVGDLWVRYMLSLEHVGAFEKDLSEIFSWKQPTFIGKFPLS
ncbi:hypothetical protein JHK85_009970 [Glycine max]|nr:hypothetical protein JHK85_009970 [Glycine max]